MIKILLILVFIVLPIVGVYLYYPSLQKNNEILKNYNLTPPAIPGLDTIKTAVQGLQQNISSSPSPIATASPAPQVTPASSPSKSAFEILKNRVTSGTSVLGGTPSPAPSSVQPSVQPPTPCVDGMFKCLK